MGEIILNHLLCTMTVKRERGGGGGGGLLWIHYSLKKSSELKKRNSIAEIQTFIYKNMRNVYIIHV